MMVIGIDPHKSTHTATVVDPETNRAGRLVPQFESTLSDYRRMLSWARQWPQRRWAVENAEGLGRHLSSWLLARGEHVVDVPIDRDRPESAALSRRWPQERPHRRRCRSLRRRTAGRRAAVARSRAPADALAVLDERRMNLAQSRVRAVNQLHALLRALLAGGAPTDLSAATAATVASNHPPSR